MSHANIYTGSDPQALMAAAVAEAAKLLSPTLKSPENHPDCHIIDLDGTISVDTARQWRQTASLAPNESDTHVFIMANADKMTVQAQNALLALLEDPPSPCSFFLLCEKPLLATINSRCKKRYFSSGPPLDEKAGQWADEFISRAALGELELLTFAIGSERLPRLELSLCLEALVQAAAENPLYKSQTLCRVVPLVKEFRRALDFNAGHGHLLAALAAKYYEAAGQ